MGNCCSKLKSPPIAIDPKQDLVDVEEEKTRQFALALNIGKCPVKIEGKFRTGFEMEKKVKYHREERKNSVDSVYEKIGPVPLDNQAIRAYEDRAKNFNIPMRFEKETSVPINIPPRRNSK